MAVVTLEAFTSDINALSPCTAQYTVESAFGGPTNLSSWLSSSGLSGSSLANTSVRLRTDLVVDMDFTFQNVDFYCEPGTRIFINSTRFLTIDGGILDACPLDGNHHEMWKGIEGSFMRLTIKNAEIRHAFTAVYANFSRLDITEVVFTENYTGMDLVGSVGFPLFTNLHSLTFDCPTELFEHYPGAGSNISFLVPLDLEKSLFAIRVTGYSNFILGSNSSKNPISKISNHHEGLRFFLCDNPRVINLSLNSIRNHNGIFNLASSCIQANTCTNLLRLSSVLGEDSENGVLCQNATPSMNNCSFDVDISGIVVQSPPSIAAIVNSDVSAGIIGISMNNARGAFLSGNRVSAGRHAITIEESQKIEIVDNPIISAGQNGIQFYNVQSSSILDNHSIHGGSSGIQFGDVQSSSVKGNQMLSSKTGLRATAAEHNTYCCNILYNNTDGIEFAPSCMHTTLQGTQFVNNIKNGLVLNQDALISPQILHGNSWSGETATKDGKYIGTDQFKVVQNRFQVSNSNTPSGGMDLDIDPSLMNWFTALPVSEPTCGSLCEGGGNSALAASGSWETNAEPNAIDLFIVNEQISGLPQEEQAIAWMRQQYLYKITDNNPQYFANPVLADFHALHESSTLGQLAEIDYGIATLSDTPAEFENEYAAKTAALEAIQQTLDANYDALHLAASEQDFQALKNERLDILNQYEPILAEYLALLDEIKMLRHAASEVLLAANEQIETTAPWESNEKTLNRFYLTYLAKDNSDYAELDKATIESIANQCLAEGGRSIFRARAMVSLWDRDFEPACVEERSGSPMSENVAMGDKIQVFPQPAGNEIRLKISVAASDVRSVQLVDQFGRTVAREFNSSKSTRLDLSKCLSGVYSLIVHFEDDSIEIEKVIVQK